MTENIDEIDSITEAAADYLFVERRPILALPNHLAVKFPDCAPLDLTLCLARLADLAETELKATSSTGDVLALWRMAALIAVDLLVMQTMELPSLTAFDLRTYWAEHDHYFLAVGPDTGASIKS